MFQLFSDPALTTPITSLSLVTMLEGVTIVPAPAVIYFGSTDAGKTVTNDGGGQITVSAVDSDPASGLPASAVRLSLTEAGLASASSTLNIGASISSGVSNALPVWVAVNASAAVGNYTDLSLTTSDMLEA